MLLRLIFLLYTGTLSFTSLHAQYTVEDKISLVRYEGLKKSKKSFLSKFITSKPQTIINKNSLHQDAQRLQNLSSIGSANYRLDTIGEKIELVFEIDEVRTLLPILNSGRITDNTWFQVGFTDINWLGKGQLLSASYLNNDLRHSGNVYFQVPRINNSNWGYSASLTLWNSLEPLFFDEGTLLYEYGNDAIGLTAIRHFSFNRNIEFGGTYFIENYQKEINQTRDFGPEQLRQPKWLGKISYNEDFLNYNLFYLKGVAWQALYQTVYSTIDKSWFQSLKIQARSYFRIGNKGNLAQRTTFAVATNNDSPFAPFVADSHVNIRGIGNRIDRGTAQLVLNTEYRQAFIESGRWGAQAVLFTDFGSWRNPGGQLKDLFNPDQFRLFAGGGIRIIYHRIFGAVIQIDYAIDLKNTKERGFVLGLGQYF